MTMRGDARGLEHLGVMAKRVEYLIGARVRNRKKILAASQTIDRLRRKVPGWESVQEIRRWRDHR
jgi:hypothetical protein